MEDALTKALLNDDDLIAVVRSHIYVERLLNKLIETLLPFPDRFADTRLGWPQRVDLAMSLGLKIQFGPPLKKLGTIRNRFAHDADAAITKKDATDLFSTLDNEERDLVHKAFNMTEKKRDKHSARQFSDMTPKDQFTLIVVTLHSMLLAAISSMTGEPLDEHT